MPRKVEVSHKTIIFTVLFLGGIWFLFFIHEILIQLFVALLIMFVLNPSITRLERAKIPRAASVLIVYMIFLAIVVFAVAAMIPALVEQTTNFAKDLPKYLTELRIPVAIVEEATSEITGQLGKLPSQLLRISVSVFSNVLSLVAVLLFGLYFSLARRDLSKSLSPFLNSEQISFVEIIVKKLEIRLSGWARGQVLLMGVVGLATFIGLTLLGVPYAIPLAVLAGILEAVPNIGPVIAAVPATIVGFSVAPITGFAVLALSFLIQQLESYLLVPKIMEKSAGINPIITLLSLIIGFRLAGAVGAVLSIPVVLTIAVILEEYLHKESHN